MTLNEKIADVSFDGLISDIQPAAIVRAKSIKRLGEAGTLKRGTILAKGADGNLVTLGTAGTAGTWTGTGDGSTTHFSLISSGVIPAALTEVKVDGTAVTTGWIYNAASGELVFDSAPANTKAIAVKTVAGEFEADCILCDDTAVGTSAEVVAAVYVSGCFDPDKTIVAEGYTLTAADYDVLRLKNILFKDAQND